MIVLPMPSRRDRALVRAGRKRQHAIPVRIPPWAAGQEIELADGLLGAFCPGQESFAPFTCRFASMTFSPARRPRYAAGKLLSLASDLLVVTTAVKPQRLSEVTDEEAGLDLGIELEPSQPARDLFLRAWRARHRVPPDRDPWVWRIGFQVE